MSSRIVILQVVWRSIDFGFHFPSRKQTGNLNQMGSYQFHLHSSSPSYSHPVLLTTMEISPLLHLLLRLLAATLFLSSLSMPFVAADNATCSNNTAPVRANPDLIVTVFNTPDCGDAGSPLGPLSYFSSFYTPINFTACKISRNLSDNEVLLMVPVQTWSHSPVSILKQL